MSTRIVRYKIPSPVSSWAKSAGSGNSSKLVVDPSGNILLAASYSGTPNFGGNDLPASTRYGFGMAIAKYDNTGTHQWSFGFKGTTDNSSINVKAVCSDISGNFYVVGSFVGTVNLGGLDLTSNNSNYQDCFIVKYSSSGVHQWSWRFGRTDGNSDDTFSSVVTDSGGSVLVAGTFRGRINLGGNDLLAGFSQESFLVKFTSAGAHLWSTDFQCTSTVNPYCMAIDQTDNVILGGTFTGAVDFSTDDPFDTTHRLTGTAPGNNTTIFLAKLSTNPNLADPHWNRTIHQWSERFGGTTFSSNAGAIAIDGNNDVILTGTFNADCNLGNGLITGSPAEAFLAKYAAVTGVYVWHKILGSFCGASAISCNLQNNNIFLGGSFIAATTFGGQTTYNVTTAGDSNGYFIKYSPGAPGTPGSLQNVLIFAPPSSTQRLNANVSSIGLDLGACIGGGLFSGIGVISTSTLNAADGNIFMMRSSGLGI